MTKIFALTAAVVLPLALTAAPAFALTSMNHEHGRTETLSQERAEAMRSNVSGAPTAYATPTHSSDPIYFQLAARPK
jgi:hypothetical protein